MSADRRPTSSSTAVAELLRRTRVERGLPPTIDDPAVVGRIAAIVAAERGGANDAA